MDDIDPAFNPARKTRRRSRAIWRRRRTLPTAAPNLSNCLGFSSL